MEAVSLVSYSVSMLLSIYRHNFIQYYVSPLAADPRTRFYFRPNVRGHVSFESIHDPGYFIVMYNSTTMGVDIPHNDNELFDEVLAPFGMAFISVNLEPQECYLAFDRQGNAYNGNLCMLDPSNVETLFHIINY